MYSNKTQALHDLEAPINSVVDCDVEVEATESNPLSTGYQSPRFIGSGSSSPQDVRRPPITSTYFMTMENENLISDASRMRTDRLKMLFNTESDISLETEKSYDSLFKKTELFEYLTYLTFNLVWLFIAASANVILFVIYSYDTVFDKTFYSNNYVFGIILICDFVVIIDIIASIVHSIWKRYSCLKDLQPRSKVLITIDIISIVWTLIALIPQVRRLPGTREAGISFITFRLYRVYWFFYIVSKTPGFGTSAILLEKYGIILFLVVHTFSCVLQACNSNGSRNWTVTVAENTYFDGETPAKWYLVCLYFMLGSITSTGFGNIHVITNGEQIIVILLMITGFLLMVGAFMGAWTTVQVEKYRRHATYSNRYNLISDALDHPRISKTLKSKIINYYKTFWSKQNGIRYSYLFEKLPNPLKQQVHLDRYWIFFNRTYLLKHLHPSFQRAVAEVMTTEIYTAGEIIYTQGQDKDSMVYVLRGSVQILSAEDGESPILTLGMGTCIGETSLLYSFKNPVQITASSYTVIQCLRKKDFWRIVVKYRKLNQAAVIFEKMLKKIDEAEESQNMKHFSEITFRVNEVVEQRTLKLVKSGLKTEDPKTTDSGYMDARRRSFNEPQYSDLYVLSLHQTKLKHSDEICLRTSWPWVLQPSSQFITFWECFLCLTVLMVVILYPYQFSFNRYFPHYLHLIMVIVGGIYVLDIVLQIFTAVENESVIITTVSDIFTIRCRTLAFITDVISIIPVATFAYIFNISSNTRLVSVFSINRLFKIHRVVSLLNKFGASFEVNVALVRCIKYVLYLLVISYFMGSAFYMMACFNVDCLKHSWYTKIKEEDLASNDTRYQHSFQLSLYFSLLVVSQTGFGDVTPYTMPELGVGMIFFVIGTLVFCYLVADYSATLMLAERPRDSYLELVTVVRKYLTSNKMLTSIQERTNDYLAIQWRINKGYTLLKDRSLLFDVAAYLYNEQNIAKYYGCLARVPLFQAIDTEVIKLICTETKLLYLPPNEIVIYPRDVVRYMYVIDRGYCEMISAASGKTEKILGPLQHFCDFDMVLERPGIHIIRTLTHARIVKIPYTNVKKVFIQFGLQEQLDKLAHDVKASLAVQRLFVGKGTTFHKSLRPVQHTSWFIFPQRKLEWRSIDYERGFEDMGCWKFVRSLLLRRTIMPDGKFIMIWEIVQAVRVFIMGMYYIPLNIFQAYFSYKVHVWLLFDFIGYVDVYIRMHTCFYNAKGILVSHPRYTAGNYISGAFFVDLISLLPTPLIIQLIVSARGSLQQPTIYALRNLMRLNKLLQIYRIPGAFYYFERDILQSTGVALSILKLLPISLVFFTALTNILLTVTCTFGIDDHGYSIITPDEHSWVMHSRNQFSFNVTEPLYLYLTGYYWVTITALSMGFGDITAQVVSEMYFVIFVIIAGYLFFTYVLVIISSSKAAVDVNVTLYQEQIRHLISYMRRENIHQDLRKKVLDHFGYIWQRTHGMQAGKILKKLHLALRQDAVLYLYERTLEKVPIFSDMNEGFYRLLGLHVEEAYYLKGSTIIRLNDIIDTFYVIHKGEVTVIGPDGSTFATLTRGCVFGNIDKVGSTRSMTSVVASQAVDLLCINTEVIYTLLEDHPTVISRLQRYLLLENMSYIERKGSMEQMNIIESGEKLHSSTGLKKLEQLTNVFSAGALLMPMMLMSFVSCIIVTYHLAFQDHSYFVLVLTYGLDFVHVIRIYAGFHTPYQNDRGETITDLKKIRERFLTPSRFYLELFSLIPFEIFALAAPKSQSLLYLSWLRINKIVRMWNIYNFFNVKFDQLNINILSIKLSSISIYFILMTHIGACFLYLMACPAGNCLKTSWIYNESGEMKCQNQYVCCLYYMVTIITFTGFGDLSPRTIPEIIVITFMTVLGKFIVSVLLGDISSNVQNYSYSLVSYDYAMTTMKEYLQANYITGPLIQRIMNYVEQLWQRDNGLQLPVLLEEAPNYLLEDIKAAAYGKHIYENFIFVSCHNDFLRLLIAKLKAETFFKNDIICHQGDVNNKMYFIHKGIVNVYDIDGHDEIQVDQLRELDCFSVIQGLFACTPHMHTYKAGTVAVILTLDLYHWVHLLRYYRATRYDIYDRVRKMVLSDQIKF